ncbi:hypothetical protein MMF93_23665 [Streptomyces tubbatahanensis]|uniref:Uncharacterized protein n=1 Tax=Streptomyces tubbatahanensis TaxID=2923272 RepID=A0ABY3XX94_9ACTN|nr:hypothetical protein [Streptomyces tubbatahanensis]UNS99124.1 hypothetical protein MMF93_23665 [Streptomyces tubbatahanensis]
MPDNTVSTPIAAPVTADPHHDALPQLVVERLGHDADDAGAALFTFTAGPVPGVEPAFA